MMKPVYTSPIVSHIVAAEARLLHRAGLRTPSPSWPCGVWCAPPEAYRLVVRSICAGLGAMRAAACRRASIVRNGSFAGEPNGVWFVGG